MVEALERQPRNFGGSSKEVRVPRSEQPVPTQTHPLLKGFLKGIITDASSALYQIEKGEDPNYWVLRVASIGRMIERAANVVIFNPDNDPAPKATDKLPFVDKRPPGEI